MEQRFCLSVAEAQRGAESRPLRAESGRPGWVSERLAMAAPQIQIRIRIQMQLGRRLRTCSLLLNVKVPSLRSCKKRFLFFFLFG